MNLVIAELQRLWARRITRFFPLVLGGLVIVGVVIAFFVMRATSNPTSSTTWHRVTAAMGPTPASSDRSAGSSRSWGS